MNSNYSHPRPRVGGDISMSRPTLKERVLSALPPRVALAIQRGVQRGPMAVAHLPRRIWNWRRTVTRRDVVNLPNVLVLMWVLVLLWGERWVFQSSIAACEWEKWERWPKDTTPHHLILLADPQIVDPHTYTGRPWPLSTLTEAHTDTYLYRSYKTLQAYLSPDTIFFLGDLFDGGREWATMRDDTSDPDWQMSQRTSAEAALVSYWKKKYGENYWLQEYERFSSIFFSLFNYRNPSGEARPGQKGRRIIASLPGNHDLGFGAKIKLPVRQRFEAMFGEANRVDVIANHTFVSIDSVSLSAGADKSMLDNREIYAPVEEFLREVKSTKRRAVERELRGLRGESTELKHPMKVQDVTGLLLTAKDKPTLDPGEENGVDFPTILLTHVPLWRNPGTPCGPLREHWPPAKPPPGQTVPVVPDQRNAIAVARGYQYQNVLAQDDSARVLKSVGNVKHVFSGDDHDYCELVHDAGNSGDGMVERVKEITVKSISYAMGVRKPGFSMVSLWNPVDGKGNPLSGHGEEEGLAPTMQTHLCLLPDQISILLRYATLIVISLIALLVRAVLTQAINLPPTMPLAHTSNAVTSKDASGSLLPTTRSAPPHRHSAASSSTSSTSSTKSSFLAPRTGTAATSRTSRSGSPAGGYGLPASAAAVGGASSTYEPPRWEEEEEEKAREGKKVRWEEGVGMKEDLRGEGRGVSSTPGRRLGREFGRAVWRVMWVVIVWYAYLNWSD